MDLYWQIGFMLGLTVATCLVSLSLYKRVILPALTQRLPPKPRPNPLPKDIQDKILRQDQVNSTEPKGESSIWMNMLIAWLFDQMRDTPAAREAFFIRTFSESAVDLRRSRLGYLLRDSRLVSLALGDSMPQLNQVRIVSNGKDEIPLTIAGECTYNGGMTSSVCLETIFGTQLWLYGQLQSLEGTLYIILKDSILYFGFGEIRHLKIEGRLMIEGYSWPWLDWLLSRFLWPSRFRSKYLMPSMKGKWLFDKPSHPPYPWDVIIQLKPELLYTWSPPPPPPPPSSYSTKKD